MKSCPGQRPFNKVNISDMKTAAEKHSVTTTRTQQSQRTFFAGEKGGGFFAPAIQTKLKVGQPDDKFEQEADATANRVMRMTGPAAAREKEQPRLEERQIRRQEEEEEEILPKIQRQEEEEAQPKLQRQAEEEEEAQPKLQRQAEEEEEAQPKIQRQAEEEEEAQPKIQRQAEEEEEAQPKIQRKAEEEEEAQPKIQRKSNGTPAVSADVQSGIYNKMSGGQALGNDTRSFMESRFNADFSKVKIHSDAEAGSLSSSLSARAFTYRNHIFFNKDQYQPGTSSGKHLLAHELTHVIQQGHAVQRKAQVSTTVTQPHVQRLGVSDALDYFAERAYLIPGFRMFTIVLGVNPINMSRANRSAANILRAIVEFMPGGILITQVLDRYSIFERAGAFVEQQLNALGITASSIRNTLNEFLRSLSWRDIFNLSGVWRRAQRIFTTPIRRIISFARGLFQAIMTMIREAVLRPLAALAQRTRGYDLLKALLGRDPVTGEPYPRTPASIIGGFMRLIGQEEVWRNIQRGGAVGQVWAWFQNATVGLMGFVRSIPAAIMQTLRSVSLRDFLNPVALFGRVFRFAAGLASRFVSWASSTVIKLLEILFSVVAPAIMPYLRRAGGAFRAILRNPVGFIRNLVTAVRQGFERFGLNILRHLQTGLIGWLTGALSGAGVYIPQAFNLREIIKFVFSILSVTWQAIRTRLVRVLGEPVVRTLETTVGVVVTLVREGPAAAWNQIRQELGNLREMVIEQIRNFVIVRIVQAAITRLVMSLNPAGAVLQAIMAIYNTIMFLVERLRTIMQVGQSILASLGAIARGAIGRAAQRVEQTMGGMLTLVISFLARLVGLGGISRHISRIIRRIRRPIDRAMNRVVSWLTRLARRVVRGVAQAGVPRDPAQRLRLGMQAAVRAVNRFAGRRVGRAVLTPLLAGIRTRYGFQRLEIVERRGRWAVRGTVNPTDDQDTQAQAGEGNEVDDAPRQTTQTLTFREENRPGRVYKIAEGNLRVLPKSQRQRDTSAQRRVSGGTGDDAGHLIGDLFGGAGGQENLSPQNWIQNRYGTFRSMERRWRNQLESGATLWVKVTDIYRAGEDRHFMREVEWRSTGQGGAARNGRLSFANTHTPRSRAARGIAPTVPSPQSGNVVSVDFQNRRRN